MSRLFGLVLLLHVYVGLRLLPDLPLGVAGLLLAASLLLGSAALIPLAMLSRQMPQPRARVLAWSGFVAMGNFSSLLVLTALRDVLFLSGLAAAMLWPLDAALAVYLGWSPVAVPLLALLVTALGFAKARRRVALRAADVPVPGLPAALHGFTIVQISDIHVGPTIQCDYIEAIVDAVNNLDADLVAVTGDLVDGSVRELARHVAPLAQLRARHGGFFVTGNHEYYSGAKAWVAELRRLGLQQRFTAGLHRVGNMWVYTSRGTGYWGPPLRFGAPSEITRLRLVPA